jgi:hypothetical protein
MEYGSTRRCRRPNFDRASDADGRRQKNELGYASLDGSKGLHPLVQDACRYRLPFWRYGQFVARCPNYTCDQTWQFCRYKKTSWTPGFEWEAQILPPAEVVLGGKRHQKFGNLANVSDSRSIVMAGACDTVWTRQMACWFKVFDSRSERHRFDTRQGPPRLWPWSSHFTLIATSFEYNVKSRFVVYAKQKIPHRG